MAMKLLFELDGQSKGTLTNGALALAAVTTVTGCGAQGGSSEAPQQHQDSGGMEVIPRRDDGPRPSFPNTITSISFENDAGGVIEVNQVTGTTRVVFNFDGGTAATSLPVPPISTREERSYDFSGARIGSVVATFHPTPLNLFETHPEETLAAKRMIWDIGLPVATDDLYEFVGMSRSEAATLMVNQRMSPEPDAPYPSWITQAVPSNDELRAMSGAERKARELQVENRRSQVSYWLLDQLTNGTHYVSERLVLFWHNIFTTSISSTPPEVMLRQHQLYRRLCVGALPEFLKSMSRDPGMVSYLDSDENVKGAPNENFARELMELFTFGESSTSQAYTEQDIIELSRCFTGYSLTPNYDYIFRPDLHDVGEKVLFGKTLAAGNSLDVGGDGDLAINLILDRKVNGKSAVGVYLTKRLWQECYGDVLPEDEAEIDHIAALWSGPYAWDLKKFYQAVAASSRAGDARRLGARFRSHLDLFIGYIRPCQIDADFALLQDIHKFLAKLEQSLLEPPDVAGWPGGSTWISTKSVLMRNQFLSNISGGNGRVREDLKPLLKYLLLTVPSLTQPGSFLDASRQARTWIMDPAFQVR